MQFYNNIRTWAPAELSYTTTTRHNNILVSFCGPNTEINLPRVEINNTCQTIVYTPYFKLYQRRGDNKTIQCK